MNPELLVDNDVLIKCACYALLDQIALAPEGQDGIGVLGAARFVARDRFIRDGRINDPEAAEQEFSRFLDLSIELEPSDDEVRFAAILEDAAVAAGVALDGGEALLSSIAIHRDSRFLLTGDKRAIAAAEALRALISDLEALDGRIVCLEQVMRGIADRIGHETTRSAVCSEPDVDKALSICFECKLSAMRPGFQADGLASYITHLRSQAPYLLYDRESFGS